MTRTRRAGNAMLELVLLLPLYVFLLYCIFAIGEYSQITIQLFQATRYSVWTTTPPPQGEVNEIFFGHFEPRGKTGSAGPRVLVPLQFNSGRAPLLTLMPGSGEELEGSPAWGVTYASRSGQNHTLQNPLWGAGGTIEQMYPNQTRNLPFPASTQGKVVALAHLALSGDVQQTGGPESPPWLRRRYGVASVVYSPMGLTKLVGVSNFATAQTLLKTKTYSVWSHAPYSTPSPVSGKEVDLALRHTAATDRQFYQGSMNNHQMDGLVTWGYLEPAEASVAVSVPSFETNPADAPAPSTTGDPSGDPGFQTIDPVNTGASQEMIDAMNGLDSSNAAERLAAAEDLGDMGGEAAAALDKLDEMANDPDEDPEVRQAAQDAAEKIRASQP